MTTTPRRPLRFGIQLQAQRTTWSEYVAALQAVERLGFDTVWNFDHMLPFAGSDDGACFETWTTLAAMAAHTSRLRLGALVNGVLYRDPATLAKAATQVDLISDGRLEFALGAAWAEREFRAYGLPFPSPRERLDRLEEALEIVHSLWTQPRTTYKGTYYTINDAPCEPKPMQRPHPPIMVGGNGRRTLLAAAKHADIWNGIGSAQSLAGCIAILAEHCATIGRDMATIELSAHPSLSLAATRQQAEAKAAAAAARNAETVDPSGWLLGSPDEVRTQLQGYIDVGVTHWIMAIGAPFDIGMLELFAREVIPAFR